MTLVLVVVEKSLNIVTVKSNIFAGMKRVFVVCLCLLPLTIFGQVNIREDSNVNKVIEWYSSLKSGENDIQGWAVQIISTRDRREMEEARNKFRLRYPQYHIKNDYVEPLYRLRVGKFINKLEALSLRNQLRSDFRSSLLISQTFQRSDFY